MESNSETLLTAQKGNVKNKKNSLKHIIFCMLQLRSVKCKRRKIKYLFEDIFTTTEMLEKLLLVVIFLSSVFSIINCVNRSALAFPLFFCSVVH